MAQSGGRPLPFGLSAANGLNGFQSSAVTTGATTVLTVPAGRTWVGTISVNTDCSVVAAGVTAGLAVGVVSIAGAGATPPAGNLLQVVSRAGANAAGGTVGTQAANSATVPLTVFAPGGNSVAIQVASTIAGTAGEVSCTCTGALQ